MNQKIGIMCIIAFAYCVLVLSIHFLTIGVETSTRLSFFGFGVGVFSLLLLKDGIKRFRPYWNYKKEVDVE